MSVFAATIDHYLAPIKAYLDDTAVAEVMINGPEEVFIEKDGKLIRTDAKFADEQTYQAAVNNILQYAGRAVGPEEPLVDARLPDGSRIHVAKSPCARHGTVVSIRKFAKSMLDIDWLEHVGTLTPAARGYLDTAVINERNLLVCGGTSSGKTSLLNALSGSIPHGQRIVVIEDSAELQLQQEHVISLEARGPDATGKGGATIRELFRSSLRLRPDRIIIGEVRGGEALDMIQAMTSGHGGSMGTLHATSPADALSRLETLALMSKVELPLHALRAQIASAIDVIVQMQRQIGGDRVVTQIVELDPMGEADRYQIRSLFELRPAEEDDRGRRMTLQWTGQRSALAGRLGTEAGEAIPDAAKPIFEEPAAAEQGASA